MRRIDRSKMGKMELGKVIRKAKLVVSATARKIRIHTQPNG